MATALKSVAGHSPCLTPNSPLALSLIAKANAMVPTLKARVEANEANRALLPETVAELRASGLIRVLQPLGWGGYELHPSDKAEITFALGRADLSVAWVYGIYAGHAAHLGYFHDDAQAEVWSENEDALISSSYAPMGRATPAPGGYRFAGHWKFSSGSSDSDWVMVGGMATDRPGEVGVFLLPRKDYHVPDTWHVLGLKGSGSNDVIVEDAFVPAHRVHWFREGFTGENPTTNPSPLYRIPPLQLFYRSLTNGNIGALETMLDEFVAYARKKPGPGGGMVADPDAQYAAGFARAEIDELKRLAHSDFDQLMATAIAGEMGGYADRQASRYRAAHVAARTLEAGKLLFESSGGTALFETSGVGIGRTYRNLLAIRQHVANQFKGYLRGMGATAFGFESPDILL